jgi:hypothetical protein
VEPTAPKLYQACVQQELQVEQRAGWGGPVGTGRDTKWGEQDEAEPRTRASHHSCCTWVHGVVCLPRALVSDKSGGLAGFHQRKVQCWEHTHTYKSLWGRKLVGGSGEEVQE